MQMLSRNQSREQFQNRLIPESKMRLSAENLALTPENTIHPLKQTYRIRPPARDAGQRKNVHCNTQGCPLKLAEYDANGELLRLSPSDKKDQLGLWLELDLSLTGLRIT